MKRLLLSIVLLFTICAAVWAAGAYDIKEMTPQVKAAFDGRKSRYADLKELKKQSAMGETNRGYVKALGTAAGVTDLADAENADRKIIYQAIVEQNGLLDSELLTVEKTFARVQRDKAESGEKFQDESGEWVTK